MTERHTVLRTAVGALCSVGLLVGCNAASDDPPEGGLSEVDAPDATDATDTTDVPDGDGDDQVPSNELVIAGEAFSPRDLLVGADRELRIVNEDDVDHTVSAWDGSFRTEVPAGETVTMTTPEPGAYPYVCEVHEHMRADLETM